MTKWQRLMLMCVQYLLWKAYHKQDGMKDGRIENLLCEVADFLDNN